MRFIARASLGVLVALPALALIAIWLCLEDAPSLTRDVRLTPQDIENARRIIGQHQAGKSGYPPSRTIVVSEQELDLMLNYAAGRFGSGAARATLGSGSIRLQASAEVPKSPFGRYINVDAVLRQSDGMPRFDRLRIGRLPVPSVVADYLLREGLRRMAATGRGALAADVVKGMTVADGRLTVTYAWTSEIEGRVRAALVSPAGQERLRAYNDLLVETLAKGPQSVSLAAVMPPMFRTALERSAGGDIVAENRAAIVVLALYVHGTSLSEIVPAAVQWPRSPPRTVTLAGRDDFPKHFLISAAIAAEAGTPLADAIGLYKEVDDARRGSGFSFNDIGADRAGTRFGEVASGSAGRARELARHIASGVREDDFMPDVADLPEYMPEAEFKHRYGGIGAPKYDSVMATIEARVASRPLLR